MAAHDVGAVVPVKRLGYALGRLSGVLDRAGRRADGRMTRLIFEKILAMPPDKKRQNAGAMASIVREFDTLREFFTSATLVAVVDLPFVFFFIWVISLIAGPLALIPLIAVPLVILSGLAIQPFLARITDSSMKSGMSKQGVLIETLNGLETVQAPGSGHLMRKRFEEASDTQSRLGLKSRLFSQFAINYIYIVLPSVYFYKNTSSCAVFKLSACFPSVLLLRMLKNIFPHRLKFSHLSKPLR